MISLQEKKKSVQNRMAVNDSIPTGQYVGKLEIMSQLESWRTAFPDAMTEVANQIRRARESSTSPD